jgi:hypothetical protein
MGAIVCTKALRNAAAGCPFAPRGRTTYEDEHRSNTDYAYRESAALEGVIGDARQT